MSGSTHITDDQLLDAYQMLRRADWPALQELKQHALHWKLIEGLALRRARGERTQTPALLAPAAPQPAPATHHAPPLPHHPPQLDFKSRAAGEREDD